MDFSEDSPGGKYVINSYTEDSIPINHKIYQSSLYLSLQQLIETIPIQSVEQISIDSLQFAFELQPELLIIGTGKTLSFPPVETIVHLAQRNIGVEAMNHMAACRTFAVLSSERRHVGALFLFDS